MPNNWISTMHTNSTCGWEACDGEEQQDGSPQDVVRFDDAKDGIPVCKLKDGSDLRAHVPSPITARTAQKQSRQPSTAWCQATHCCNCHQGGTYEVHGEWQI